MSYDPLKQPDEGLFIKIVPAILGVSLALMLFGAIHFFCSHV